MSESPSACAWLRRHKHVVSCRVKRDRRLLGCEFFHVGVVGREGGVFFDEDHFEFVHVVFVGGVGVDVGPAGGFEGEDDFADTGGRGEDLRGDEFTDLAIAEDADAAGEHHVEVLGFVLVADGEDAGGNRDFAPIDAGRKPVRDGTLGGRQGAVADGAERRLKIESG